MKKILFLGLLLLINNLNAQKIEEPEFVGEVLLLTSSSTAQPLEKHISQSRQVASTGLIMTGIGKYRTQLQIDGCCSNTKINKSDDIKFIIRAVDNNTDPLSIIKIFKFEQKKKYRRAEVASISAFGSAKSNNLEYIPFVGKRYGKNSYIITISTKEVGEYGITISNPNALDEKATVVSSFSIVQ